MTLINETGFFTVTASTRGLTWSRMTKRLLKSGLNRPRHLCISLQVMGDVQDKSSAYAALDEEDVDTYLASLIHDEGAEPQCDCQE